MRKSANIFRNKFRKKFYSTQELVEHEEFPIRSTNTITKLIESGELDGVNISTTQFKRYRIGRESIIKFLTKRFSKPMKEAPLTTNKKS